MPEFCLSSGHDPFFPSCCTNDILMLCIMHYKTPSSPPVGMRDAFNGGWLNRAATVFKLLGKWELRKWGKFPKLQYRACCCRLGPWILLHPARSPRTNSRAQQVSCGSRKAPSADCEGNYWYRMALFVWGDRHSYGAGSCSGSDCRVWCPLAPSYRPCVRWLQIYSHWTVCFFLIWYGRQQSDGEQCREV